MSEKEGDYVPPEKLKLLALQRGEHPGNLNESEQEDEEEDNEGDDEEGEKEEEEEDIEAGSEEEEEARLTALEERRMEGGCRPHQQPQRSRGWRGRSPE